ncbi:YqiA/YcfP family alpha/beta fold hydrolase [Ideonella sp. DXS22W]|uniref:YqiA/YcfP family alpha/beta fold hydrolase n=1 Tax=Pseudaquabacterium inlustre TaxID=2984192 RepID=A0ABU9CD49_9BURK
MSPAPATPITHLLYLHGFRSSPKSFKARRMHAWMAAHRPDVVWCCPQLPPSPAEAWALIQHLIADWPHERMAVVGSSLGGFYATAVAEATGCRAMLLNPAVDPARDLAAYIGEQTAFHTPEERFFFREEFIAELRSLTVPAITRPDRYGAVIARGDEVLSWQEMTGRYPGATIRLLDGSDHAISDFDDHLPFVLNFLTLCD